MKLKIVILFVYSLCGPTLGQSSIGRNADPVVLKGSDVPELALEPQPERLVGFFVNRTTALWQQAPIQIDEMHYQKWDTIKRDDCRLNGRLEEGFVWADAGTYSGPDEDPTFDADDELVFMARHLGAQRFFQGDRPPGTLPDVDVELEIIDPRILDAQLRTLGFFYIFKSDGSLAQDAGQPLVQYELNLIKTDSQGSNDYFDAYQLNCEDPDEALTYECHTGIPMNPEDSWVSTPYYSRHYSENWFSDDIKIYTDGASGESFFDSQDFQFLLQNCGRSVASFVRGTTAFIINKSGPVRAMRSWIGANSGVITVRETHSYEMREDQVTWLRVHLIPGVMDVSNYKEGVPLTYYNEHNTQGIVVDGSMVGDEAFDNSFSHWDIVQGATGTYIRTVTEFFHQLINDNRVNETEPIPPVDEMKGWWFDNQIPICPDCGDEGSAVHPHSPQDWHMCSSVMSNQTAAWGSHGFKGQFLNPIGNTDPTRHMIQGVLPEEACRVFSLEPLLYAFNVTYSQYYLGPNVDPMLGAEYYQNSINPLMRA